MQIVMNRTIQPKGGAAWPKGAKLTTDADELKRREVPADSYDTVGEGKTTEVNPADTKTKPVRKKKPTK